MTLIHHLTDDERKSLAMVNAALAGITDHHCHTCRCGLCSARALTDVQDEAAYHVRYTPGGRERN